MAGAVRQRKPSITPIRNARSSTWERFINNLLCMSIDFAHYCLNDHRVDRFHNQCISPARWKLSASAQRVRASESLRIICGTAHSRSSRSKTSSVVFQRGSHSLQRALAHGRVAHANAGGPRIHHGIKSGLPVLARCWLGRGSCRQAPLVTHNLPYSLYCSVPVPRRVRRHQESQGLHVMTGGLVQIESHWKAGNVSAWRRRSAREHGSLSRALCPPKEQ